MQLVATAVAPASSDYGRRGVLFLQVVCAHALKRLTLPRDPESGEIALAGSHRLHPTHAAAPVHFALPVVTETMNG